MTILAREIKKARGKRTMDEVCPAIGITKSYLCDIEHDRRTPPPEARAKGDR